MNKKIAHDLRKRAEENMQAEGYIQVTVWVPKHRKQEMFVIAEKMRSWERRRANPT